MTLPKIEKYLEFNFYNFLKCWLVYKKITISHFFGHFSNVISLAKIDFWEKSFCTVVSIYKCFNLTRSAHTSEIHQPALITHIIQMYVLGLRTELTITMGYLIFFYLEMIMVSGRVLWVCHVCHVSITSIITVCKEFTICVSSFENET